MQWRDVRSDFPMPDHEIQLNAASHAVPGSFWLDGMEEAIEFYRTGRIDSTRGDPATHPYMTKTFHECIDRSADLIGAHSNEVTNMYRPMTAVNLIINDLLDWESGDNVVFTDLQYPSLPYVLLGLREREGVELRRVENVDGEIRTCDLADAMDDDTKLVCINRTTCWCGFTYDVEAVCDVAHDHGALVLDDAMQALGAIDVDVHADGVDFLVSGSYKWLCGPEGAGIFYVREGLIDEFDPSFRNYFHANFPDGIPFSEPDHDNVAHWDYPLVENANRYDQEVCVTPVLFGWNETLKYLSDIGMDNIESRVRGLGDYLIGRLRDIGCEVVTPNDPKNRHGLIVYTTGDDALDQRSQDQFKDPSAEKKPIFVTNRSLGGVGGIRVSTHFYNTKAELDELVERQQEILG